MNVKILNVVPIFDILSQFNPNFLKTETILSIFKLRPNLIFIKILQWYF